MIYSKKQIEQYSDKTGFVKHYIEKVVRLLDVLRFVFSECSFKDKLILKGGTAINLVHTNLKRLSVDIDLDYFGSIDRETAINDRRLLEEELDKHMIMEKYEISTDSRSSFALFSRIYKFKNAFNNFDTIKVDINFMNRIHLYHPVVSTVNYFDKTVILRTPAIEELFGMKINALLDRSKPRDLYDSAFLISNMKLFDRDMLRKAVVFYLSLNNIFKLNNASFNKIKELTNRSIKKELLPVLKKSERFNLNESQNNVINFLNELLILTNNEKKYLIEFSKGNYAPNLLFEDSIALKVEKHPMAMWRILNLNK